MGHRSHPVPVLYARVNLALAAWVLPVLSPEYDRSFVDLCRGMR